MIPEVYQRLNGDWVLGDYDDDAPLLILSFKNAYADFDNEARQRIAIAAFIAATRES